MAGLQAELEDFREEGVQIVTLSADDEEGARTMKEEEGLDFPVLHSLDVDEIRDRFGLYVEKKDRTHLQPAQLLVRPDGTIHLATYSSGKVGRLTASEVIEIVRSAKDG